MAQITKLSLAELQAMLKTIGLDTNPKIDTFYFHKIENDLYLVAITYNGSKK